MPKNKNYAIQERREAKRLEDLALLESKKSQELEAKKNRKWGDEEDEVPIPPECANPIQKEYANPMDEFNSDGFNYNVRGKFHGNMRGRFHDNVRGGFVPQMRGEFYDNMRGGFHENIRGGFVPQMRGFVSQMRGGFVPQTRGGFVPQMRGGFVPQTRGGFVPQMRGGFVPQMRDGFVPQMRDGFVPQMRDGFVPNARGGFIANMRGGFIPNIRGGFNHIQPKIVSPMTMDEFLARHENSQILIIRENIKKNTATRTYVKPNSLLEDVEKYDYIVSNKEECLPSKIDYPDVQSFYFQELPITQYLDDILELYKKEKYIVVAASTGSGKSTCLPAQLAISNPNARILVVGPTISSCESLAKRVQSQYPNLHVGSGAGGRILYDQNTQIVFATAGHVQNILFINRNFKHFTDLIIDEAHTVSAEYEIIFLLMQEFGIKSLNGVIISSATVQKQMTEPLEALIGHPVAQFELEVPMYPIIETFEDSMMYDDISLIGAILEYIIDQNQLQPFGHFLVFCPGEDMINKLYKLMTEEESITKNCFLFCAHASQPYQENDISFAQKIPTDNIRSIILATNIAETSLTIPGVVLVVDSGQQKIVTLGDNDASKLMTVDVSAFAPKQRAGRTGRTCPGTVHRMYTENHKSKFQTTYDPELQRIPLNDIILKFLSFDVSPIRVLCKHVDTDEKVVGMPILDLCLIQGAIENLEKLQLIVDNKPTEEAMELCSMPALRLPLKRCYYAIKNDNKMTWETKIICQLAVVITEVESNQTLTYYRKQRQNESKEDFVTWCTKQRELHKRFIEHSCCPLNSCIAMFICFANEIDTQINFTAATQKWSQDNSMNQKAMMEVCSLLLKLSGTDIKQISKVSFDTKSIMEIFMKHCIPVFKKGYTGAQLEYIEKSPEKWFLGSSTDFSRLNNHGFGKYVQLNTNHVLALVISETQGMHGRVFRFLSVYVPLARCDDFDSEF